MQDTNAGTKGRYIIALVSLCAIATLLFLVAVLQPQKHAKYVEAKHPPIAATQVVKQEYAPAERPDIVWGELQQGAGVSDTQMVLNYTVVRSDSCVQQASAVEYEVQRKENTLLVDLHGHDLTRTGDICASVISYDDVKLPIALTDSAHLEDIVITLDGKTNRYAVESSQIRPIEVMNVYLFGDAVDAVEGYDSVDTFCEQNDTPACANLNNPGGAVGGGLYLP